MPLTGVRFEEYDRIRQWVTEYQPLGPIDAARIDDLFVANILFDEQNRLYNNQKRRPIFIIGRRGSGKTAFLKHTSDKGEYDIVISADMARLFDEIILSIDGIIKNNGYIFVEKIAEMWEAVFYASISKEIALLDKGDQSKFKGFVQRIGADANLGGDGFINRVVGLIAKKSPDKDASLLAEIVLEIFGKKDISELKRQVCDYVAENNIKAIILIDTLEQYDGSIKNFPEAISGLVKASNGFNNSRSKPEIRFCIPTERYEYFRDSASNVAKDFANNLMLHWHVTEILSIIAHRILIHLHLYDWDDSRIRERYSDFDFRDKKKLKWFFSTIMPQTIVNRVGHEEPTLSYIMRHTQMLPRQAIQIFESIILSNQQSGRHITEISDTAIIDGISNIEDTLWRDVCNAYKYKFNWIQEAAEAAIADLPVEFSDSELHILYNEKGFKKSGIEYNVFKKSLLEVGCIGLKIRDGEIYTESIFEYSLPGIIMPRRDSKFTLHPMFCGGFKTLQLQEAGIKRVILPHGASPDSRDNR